MGAGCFRATVLGHGMGGLAWGLRGFGEDPGWSMDWGPGLGTGGLGRGNARGLRRSKEEARSGERGPSADAGSGPGKGHADGGPEEKGQGRDLGGPLVTQEEPRAGQGRGPWVEDGRANVGFWEPRAGQGRARGGQRGAGGHIGNLG